MIRTVIVHVASLAVIACGGATAGDRTEEHSIVSESSVAQRSGAACFAFTAEVLRGRSWAFDGTIVSLGMRRDADDRPVRIAQFEVHRWFKGGVAAQVTVRWFVTVERVTNGEWEPTLTETNGATVGSRFLVSGERTDEVSALAEHTAYGCGFTQAWSEERRQAWAAVYE